MKKYTILQDAENNVMLIENAYVYDVVYLCTSIDKAYIYNKENEELTSTDGFYPSDWFERDDKEILVIKKEDIDCGSASNVSGGEYFTVIDGWDEVEVVDVTSTYMSYIYGHAIDIEHGINTDQVLFDLDDADMGWKSIAEVDAESEHEHDQDYPRQEATRLYYCDNGMVIRETSPFFADKDRDVYEIVSEKKYTVWYNNNVESNKVAEFDTLNEAKVYCKDNTEGYDEVADGDNDYEGRSNNFRYEVYDGEPIETTSDGDGIFKGAIYQTEQYYCK